jgi:hypothetical protein
MNRKIVQEFVFGYGSLICPKSRSITAPSMMLKTVTPVVVKNVERTWAKRVEGVMTAMGVRFKDDAQCVGVLLPVEKWELKKFDQREQGYDRVPLYLGDVQTVPFLDKKHYRAKGHEIFLKAKQRKHSIKIWMYLQQKTDPPSNDAPIVQSYVDTILRGCLSISQRFAHEFIVNTKGWTPNELEWDDDDNFGVSENGNDSMDDGTMNSSCTVLTQDDVHWLNDRHDPIYSRGDQQYMLKNGHVLDDLLKRHRDEFKYRSIPPAVALHRAE